ncbi:MAG: hypothetical protein KZQ82_14405 [Candidatus Thiodiazotropha sp. (ex Lucinoma annulata)]|nr:hypothetical protein [Candidatus Thiodiazotropha sp. (ex Lucinoma annulata)]
MQHVRAHGKLAACKFNMTMYDEWVENELAPRLERLVPVLYTVPPSGTGRWEHTNRL